MKQISNSTIKELQRLIPVIIAQVPPRSSTRVQNAVRLTRNILKKLEKAKDV